MGLCAGLLVASLMWFAQLAMPIMFAWVICLPLVVDGLSQLSGLRESNNALRFFSGLVFSVGIVQILFRSLI